MFFMIWVLLDARNYLRYVPIAIITRFLCTVSNLGLRDTLHRCHERWPNAYDNVRNLRELLLYGASCHYVKIASAQSVEWRNDKTICWLLESGADPNWANCGYFSDTQPLTSFEWFLLSVPQICFSSSGESVGLRIAATIRAFIEAGANLDRVICLSREASASTTWGSNRRNQELDYEDIKHDKLEIIIELNICQLVNYTRSYMQDCLLKQDPDMLSHLEKLGKESCKSCRKVLCVSKVSGSNIHSAVVSTDDSDHIFGLLDSERVSKKLSDGEATFTVEIHSSLERILSKGEKIENIDIWLTGRGYQFEGGQGDLVVYMARDGRSNQFYSTMFPNLAHEKDIEDDAGGLKAEVQFIEDE